MYKPMILEVIIRTVLICLVNFKVAPEIQKMHDIPSPSYKRLFHNIFEQMHFSTRGEFTTLWSKVFSRVDVKISS